MWSHIFLFGSLRRCRPPEFTAILMFEFWREATATSVPALLCQSGHRRPKNVSILSSLVTPGRQREHAQHVSSLKIYFRSRLTTVASRILKVPNLSSKALRCHISLKTYDLKFTLLWERASMRWLLMRALEKQLQDFTEMITIRSFIFLTIYVPILRVWMGEDKGQLSVKILPICQLLVKF